MTEKKTTLLDIIKMTPQQIESLTGFSEQDTKNILAEKRAHDEWESKMPWREITNDR